MKSFPSCWNKTLAQLGFRRKRRRYSSKWQYGRRSLFEGLEVRHMLTSAPVLDPISNQSLSEGQTLLIEVPFSDADTGQTHTATIDWGDGNIEPVQVLSSPDRVRGQHVYTDNGSYNVTVPACLILRASSPRCRMFHRRLIMG
jgi:hypothetical protein